MSTEDLTPEQRADLEKGLRQSAAGETVYLGSFAEYAEAPRRDTAESVLSAVLGHWRVIRSAQFDMLNGRPDMDAMEEIALASAAIDELLTQTQARESTP